MKTLPSSFKNNRNLLRKIPLSLLILVVLSLSICVSLYAVNPEQPPVDPPGGDPDGGDPGNPPLVMIIHGGIEEFYPASESKPLTNEEFNPVAFPTENTWYRWSEAHRQENKNNYGPALDVVSQD